MSKPYRIQVSESRGLYRIEVWRGDTLVQHGAEITRDLAQRRAADLLLEDMLGRGKVVYSDATEGDS